MAKAIADCVVDKGIICPRCGAEVRVRFRATTKPTNQPGDAAADRAVFNMTLTQVEPMVCICGFTYIPPLKAVS